MEVSYSCMNNMTKIINLNNKNVSSERGQANQNFCNCQNPDNCRLDNKCLTSKIIYSAGIITDNQQSSKVYLRISKTEFKLFNNHQVHLSKYISPRTLKVHLGNERQTHRILIHTPKIKRL